MSISIGNTQANKIFRDTPNGFVEVTDVYFGSEQGAVKIWANKQNLARIKFKGNAEVDSFFADRACDFSLPLILRDYITINGEQYVSLEHEYASPIFAFAKNNECVISKPVDFEVREGNVIDLRWERNGVRVLLVPNKKYEELYGEGVLCAFSTDTLPGLNHAGDIIFDLKEGEEARIYDAQSGRLVAERSQVGRFYASVPYGKYLLKGNLPEGSGSVEFNLAKIVRTVQATVQEVEYKCFD